MIRDLATYPKRPSVFHTPFSFPDGKEGKLKTFDVQFTAEEEKRLREVHELCKERISLPLPDLDAPVEKYQYIRELDEMIAIRAQELPNSIQELIGETVGQLLRGGPDRQTRAVWQSFFVSNPILL